MAMTNGNGQWQGQASANGKRKPVTRAVRGHCSRRLTVRNRDFKLKRRNQHCKWHTQMWVDSMPHAIMQVQPILVLFAILRAASHWQGTGTQIDAMMKVFLKHMGWDPFGTQVWYVPSRYGTHKPTTPMEISPAAGAGAALAPAAVPEPPATSDEVCE